MSTVRAVRDGYRLLIERQAQQALSGIRDLDTVDVGPWASRFADMALADGTGHPVGFELRRVAPVLVRMRG
jgi:hypothetical protein